MDNKRAAVKRTQERQRKGKKEHMREKELGKVKYRSGNTQDKRREGTDEGRTQNTVREKV